MARAITSFPTIFEKMTRQVLRKAETMAVGGEPLLRIPLASRGESVNLQMQLRQYWKALAEMHQSGMSMAIPGIVDIAPRAHMLACRYNKEDKSIVEVIHKNQMVSGLRIAAAMEALETSLGTLDSEDTPLGIPERKEVRSPAVVATAPTERDARMEALLRNAFPEGKPGKK